jgi:hypothetical protein
MKLKTAIATILEENQNEYFCQFCTNPKVATTPICSCSGNWFKLCDFDFDTQFSIASTILNSKKGLPDKESD